MSLSIDHTVARRRPRQAEPCSVYQAFEFAASRAKGWRDAIHWPTTRYASDPVGFARDICGINPWEKQVEFLEAVRDHKRVAVCSGHKVSKSNSLAILALWFFATRQGARVVMSCVTARQVDEILYRECKILHGQSGTCFPCRREIDELNEKLLAEGKDPLPYPKPCEHSTPLDGEPRELARTGIKTADHREIVGFTAREPEAVAGVSGANLLYLLDEASGIPDKLFEAIDGNRAGGARVVMTSNPTKTEGRFYEAFDKRAEFWHRITISSADSPNVKARRVVIPGLAEWEWVEEMRREWGEDSPLYKVRVLGQFVKNEEGKIISVDAITQAEARWANAADDVGRLQIGIDPAGDSGTGDESAFAVRRGAKVLELIAKRGLTPDAHLSHLLGILEVHHHERKQKPAVVVDLDGLVNARVHTALALYADAHPDAFELIGVRASDPPREPRLYDRTRDELWASLARWMRPVDKGGAGGAIPTDAKLAAELHAPSWEEQVNGRVKATPKDVLRQKLERSPDRADAVALAVWEVSALSTVVERTQTPREAIDPYANDGHADNDPVYGGVLEGGDPVYG